MQKVRVEVCGKQRGRTAEIAHHSPPVRWWHVAVGLLVLPLLLLAIWAPGITADWSELVLIPSWEAAVMPRALLIVLTMWAFFGIRAYHPLTGVALVLIMPAALLRIGNAQIVHEDLTLALALYLLALSILPIRVILRPNESDYFEHVKREVE